MAIPKNLEDVGYNQATLPMDVDAIVRESLIRIFNLTGDNGQPLDPYDEKYLDMMEQNSGLDPVNSGAGSLIRQFVFLEGKILGFIFQQFIYKVQPIQVALELPVILAQPPQLLRKIKEIIQGIKDLINDVIEFFTDTLNWVLSQVAGEIFDINIPVPPLEFNILGIRIPLPSIDNLNKLGKEPFLENLTDKALELKDKISSANERIKNLSEKINPDIAAMQVGLVDLLNEQLKKLLSIDYQLVNEFYEVAYKIHTDVIIEKNNIVKGVLESRELSYRFNNRGDELEDIIDYINANSQQQKYLTDYSGIVSRLTNAPDRMIEILESEENQIEDIINQYKLESNETLNEDFQELDVTLNELNQQLSELRAEIGEVNTEIDDTYDGIDNIKENERPILTGVAAAAASETIEQLKEQIKKDKNELAQESPASVFLEQIIDLIIGVVKSPFDMIINILVKIIEAIIEFFKELPLPTFSKIKEFFSDLIGLGIPNKMEEAITNIVQSVTGAGEQFEPVLENIAKFLPWLFVEVATQFIAGVVQPLPLPI